MLISCAGYPTANLPLYCAYAKSRFSHDGSLLHVFFFGAQMLQKFLFVDMKIWYENLKNIKVEIDGSMRVVKPGFTFFSYFLLKHRVWIHVRTVSLRRF